MENFNRTQDTSITEGIILAAGLSTRLGIQKSLIDIDGKPLIEWMKNNLLSAGIQRVYAVCLLYTSPSPRDRQKSRMPSSA